MQLANIPAAQLMPTAQVSPGHRKLYNIHFLEIEVLYPDEGSDTAAYERHIRNAQVIFDTLLTALEIPQSAIEVRPYNELLACRCL